MKFTEEERKYIDWKLKKSDARQKENGNKTYTVEELRRKFLKTNVGEQNY